MRKVLIRLTQVLALAMIGTGFLADASLAESKMYVVKALCEAAKGKFVYFINGDYGCVYPENGNVSHSKYCDGDTDKCTWRYCGNYGCYTAAVGGKESLKKVKRQEDGTTIMTAGTVNDRGLGAKNGTASGAVTNGTLAAASPRPASPPTATSPALANSSATNPVVAKPPSIWSGAVFGTRPGQVQR